MSAGMQLSLGNLMVGGNTPDQELSENAGKDPHQADAKGKSPSPQDYQAVRAGIILPGERWR